MRIRTLVVAVAIAVAALAATGVAVGVPSAATAFDSEQPAYYSGCITANGRLEAMAVGLSPKRACTSAEKPVHVSGGDITSIQGGTGIRISSDPIGLVDGSGSARIEIMGRYRLPATCQTGQTPVWQGTAWACTSPAAGPTVFHGQDFSGGQVGNDYSTVGSLSLPAGTYHLLATVTAENLGPADANADETAWLVCRLDVTGQSPRDSAFYRNSDGAPMDATTLTLTGVTTLAAPGNVSVVCRDSLDGSSYWETGMEWRKVKIVATTLSGLTQASI